MLKNKYLWAGIVLGLILGDIIGVKLFGAASTKTADTSSAEMAAPSSFSLIVAGNQTAGDRVMVMNATVATSTWLAVRENNGDLLGRILGASRIPSGESKNVIIELLRPTIPHLMYAVVMYSDDGDAEFDHKLDGIIEAYGQPIIYPFTVN